MRPEHLGPWSIKFELKKNSKYISDWMAPEMMKMMKYDEKVDIFSFGIVLCEVSKDSSIAKCQKKS